MGIFVRLAIAAGAALWNLACPESDSEPANNAPDAGASSAPQDRYVAPVRHSRETESLISASDCFSNPFSPLCKL